MVWFAHEGTSALILWGDSVWEFCVWLLNGFCIINLCRNLCLLRSWLSFKYSKFFTISILKTIFLFVISYKNVLCIANHFGNSNFGKYVSNYDYQSRICTFFSSNLTYCSILLQNNIFFITNQFDWSNFGKSIQFNIVILTSVNHLY